MAVHLAKTYRDLLEQLDERFGGYASFWRYCAERLVENPPKEEILPYPLWESCLWEEWVGSSRPRLDLLQSGLLAGVSNRRGR
jgi:hypothetical protein